MTMPLDPLLETCNDSNCRIDVPRRSTLDDPSFGYRKTHALDFRVIVHHEELHLADLGIALGSPYRRLPPDHAPSHAAGPELIERDDLAGGLAHVLVGRRVVSLHQRLPPRTRPFRRHCVPGLGRSGDGLARLPPAARIQDGRLPSAAHRGG